MSVARRTASSAGSQSRKGVEGREQFGLQKNRPIVIQEVAEVGPAVDGNSLHVNFQCLFQVRIVAHGWHNGKQRSATVKSAILILGWADRPGR
jgi:hypothetical protein